MTKQCLWRLDTGVCCNVDFSINFIQYTKFQTSLFGIVTVDFFVDGFPFCFVSLRWIFVETLRWIFCSSTHFQCLESLRWNSFRGQNQGFPQCIPLPQLENYHLDISFQDPKSKIEFSHFTFTVSATTVYSKSVPMFDKFLPWHYCSKNKMT